MDTQKEQPNSIPTSTGEKVSDSSFLNRSLESYIEFEEKWADALAKFLTKNFGTLRFLNIVIIFSLFWITINLGQVQGIIPFDPYPFNWLMTIIQLFGIILSVVVLISQNREERINEVYQKMDFEINVRAEHEVTKILQMLEDIHKEMGIAKIDRELEHMKEKIDISEVKETVEQAIEEKDNTSGIA